MFFGEVCKLKSRALSHEPSSDCVIARAEGGVRAQASYGNITVLSHLKCCISADSKVQASTKHETEVKPIRACRVHSGALDELTSQRSTGKCSLLFFKFGDKLKPTSS